MKVHLLSTTSPLRFYAPPGDYGLSEVTAIVDHGNGVRVVITKPELIHFHVGENERCYTVPDYWVWEPPPIELLPAIVGVAMRHLARATNRAHELESAQTC